MEDELKTKPDCMWNCKKNNGVIFEIGCMCCKYGRVVSGK